MSKSYRTQKAPIVARRRIERTVNGEPMFPRVIQRRPAVGDAHPLPARFVRRIFAQIPLEYLHGLAFVELRSRPGAVGEPFGFYRPAERSIVLYSLPPVWKLARLSASEHRSLERFFATIVEDESGFQVSWRSPEVLALWFYCEVFAHELGHHRRYQYRHKDGLLGRRLDEETVADLHARRLTDRLFAEFRRRR